MDAVFAAIPDREVVVFRDRRLTQSMLSERSRRLAAYLTPRGLGTRAERGRLEGHEVGQDTLGIYAYNGNEYVESMLGAFRARIAPFNVTYRYGWLAQRGFVPLGYKGDPEKTTSTFPVVEGERFALPGDRAQRLEDGSIHLLGRDSITINSGGEKVFVEEVEMAISSHPAVADVLVAGRPSDMWGEAVAAIVQLLPDHEPTAGELVNHAANSIARYKLPKSVIFTETIRRSPVGKADHRWAREQAAELGTTRHPTGIQPADSSSYRSRSVAEPCRIAGFTRDYGWSSTSRPRWKSAIRRERAW